MTIPSVDGVQATNSLYNNPYLYGGYNLGMASPLYNDSVWDMGSTMSTGYNPISAGMDYGLFNTPGLMSPYGYGYDTFGYGGMYGMYGYSPAAAQAMVQSQSIYMDGMAALNSKQRQINYNGQVDTMGYNVKLNDAKDTTGEDFTRRDTNIEDVCKKINERLEVKDTKGFMDAYNYGLALYAKVYSDVNSKRSDETPSDRTSIKAAFNKRYAELNGGKTIQQKIDECLSGAFGSGFDSVWKMENVDSKEEVKALIEDRPVAYKKQEATYKTFGKITGGVANTALWGGAGTVAGGISGAGIGALFKNAKKGGKYGMAIGLIAGLATGIARSCSRD